MQLVAVTTRPKTTSENVPIISNLTKKHSEFNDLLRFAPFLAKLAE